MTVSQLTAEERWAARYDDIRMRPETEHELFVWALGYFGWRMARRSICTGHQAPLSILADMVFERELDMLILANRNGGKTSMLAVANLYDSLFKPGCEIASVGAIMEQAKKCFSYLQEMVEMDLLEDVTKSVSERLTILHNGSEIRILPGTDTGVNSPHPHKARADEVELIEWKILQQFFSMARSERGILGQNILASTRKTLKDSMQKLIDKVNNDRSFPFVLRQWCVSGDAHVETPHGPVRLRDLNVGEWIYGYDLDAGRTVVSRVKNKACVGVKPTVKIKLRAGAKPPYTYRELVVTPDHKLLLRNEAWVQAQDLLPGHALLAIGSWHDKDGSRILKVPARAKPKIVSDGSRGYRQVAGRTARENRFVYESVHGSIPNRHVVHHIDGMVLNNDPENLNAVPRAMHSKGHIGEMWKDGRFIDAVQKRREFYERNPEVLSERNRKVNLNRRDRSHPVQANHVVVSVESAGTAEVWDIEVEGCHTFFAEDVVVKNCLWEVMAQNPEGGPDCPCKEFERADGKTFYQACQGRCRESDGFYMPQDAWRKFATLDDEVWDSEWECLRPAKRGVIYKDMPDERFGHLEMDSDRTTFAFCDWGFVDPFTFYVAQADSGDNIYVLREIYTPGLAASEMAERASDLFEEMGLSKSDVMIYPDPRGSTEIAEFRKAGFQLKPKSVEIDGGIKWVKNWVRGYKHPKLFVDGAMCPNLKWEMTEGYQYKGETEVAEDKANHGCDALRYGIVGKYPIRRTVQAASEVPVSAGDGHSQALRAPTPREIRRVTQDRERAESWPFPRPQ